ncbi:MAG: helix-turn-helix transcriptional regulator [Gammaproteobacteria bacterium]
MPARDRRDIADAVVADIYRAASGAGAWGAVLEAISDDLKLRALQIIGVDKRDASLVFSLEGGNAPFTSKADYVRSYHAINPRIPPSLGLKPGEWLHDHELFDEDFVATNRFYQEFLIPSGARHVSATKLMDEDDSAILMGAVRGVDQHPLSQQELALLDRYRTHLASALDIWRRNRRSIVAPPAGRSVIARMPAPILLLDGQRMLQYANPAAHALLGERTHLQIHEGYLRCRRPDDDQRLTEALLALNLHGNEVDSRQRAERVVLRIRSASGTSIQLVILSRLPPDPTLAVLGHASLAMAVLHQLDVRRHLDPAILVEAFGLTSAEAQVARLLAEGHSMQDIASQRGVSLETVRSQVRAVFAKTDTRRQPDLVRLLAEIPVVDDVGVGEVKPDHCDRPKRR